MIRILLIATICIITTKVGAQSSTLFVADSLYKIGNYSKAIESYHKLENTSYTNTQIAKAYKALGNTKKAIKSYEMVLEVDVENVLVLYDYGKLLYSTGKLEKSLAIFEKLKEKDTLNPNFHYQIGLAKEALLQPDFINAYETAFALDSQHQKSSYKLIKNYMETQKYEDAEAVIKVGLKNNADDVKIIGFKAQLYYAYKEHRKALAWFEKLIHRKKATRYVYEKAAFCAYRVRQITKSINYYEEALKRDRGNYFYHSQLAKLYYQDVAMKKAEHHASQAILGKMTDPSGDYYILGLVHFDRKEHGKAIKLFKMALDENPDYEAAQFQLALCADNYYADLKQKLKMYERFLEKFPKAKIEMQNIVKTRIRELKEEIHLKSE
ncbi:tetratricopeptide repeat protein [Kordia algicida OT-1]|uniref:Tetratricopeptide repeat family protein n=1 Tax=Kordia algicida OT-1 TaxID=391587 RepID=A9DJS9_9FLAO|nr:tetratricopeptide repeat protein [Kordia algicida]EDP98176.1 Tetratricopeptide repeat family protein [Kordia algicida OT-1]